MRSFLRKLRSRLLAADGAGIRAHRFDDRATLESISRRECQMLYLGDQIAVCRVLGTFIMYVDSQEYGIAPHLCLDGYWEPWITLALARTIRPGWRCVDVGANYGYYTLLMAEAVGAGGMVLAAEPNPHLAELLRRNVSVNGFLRSTTFLAKAISERNAGSVSFVVPEGNRSMNGTLCMAAGAGDRVYDVETVTLDDAIADWPRVDFIKVDAEGAEEAIWRGMQRTLQRSPDVTIVMEVNALKYGDPARFFRGISEAGFPLRYIDYDSEIKEVSEGELVSNPSGLYSMLFLRKG